MVNYCLDFEKSIELLDVVIVSVVDHKIREWFELKETLKIMYFHTHTPTQSHPFPVMGRDTFP